MFTIYLRTWGSLSTNTRPILHTLVQSTKKRRRLSDDTSSTDPPAERKDFPSCVFLAKGKMGILTPAILLLSFAKVELETLA